MSNLFLAVGKEKQRNKDSFYIVSQHNKNLLIKFHKIHYKV